MPRRKMVRRQAGGTRCRLTGLAIAQILGQGPVSARISAVICPYCAADNDKVIDSRASDGGVVIRRRRECLACSKRFTTYERVEKTSRLAVVKKDGRREPFVNDKIMASVQA